MIIKGHGPWLIMLNLQKNSKLGFTLIELLVVIAIISILASVVLASLRTAREKSKVARAEADVYSLFIAAQNLLNDTGNFPYGCPTNAMYDPTGRLDHSGSGLVSKPPVGNSFWPGYMPHPCTWTAQEIALWNGPYVQGNVLEDPWGNGYIVDYDYFGNSGCPPKPDGVAIASSGRDGILYNCDDPVRYLYIP
jgi:prepilin-type N-terminal cleavage/methylation domain-containing protein